VLKYKKDLIGKKIAGLAKNESQNSIE